MILLGILLIIIGIFSIIEVFTDINLWFQVTDFWPLLLIIYGIYKIIKNRRAKVSSFLIIAVGVLFQLDKLGLLTPKLSTIIWASTLVIIGIILIIPDSTKRKFKEKQNHSYTNENSSKNGNYHYEKTNYYEDVKNDEEKSNKNHRFTNFNFRKKTKNNNPYENSNFSHEATYEDVNENEVKEEIFTEIGSNLLDLSYAFGSHKIKVRSSSFSGGDISTTFGETVLDLRNVYPASRIIELYCNVYVGNLELILPYDWSYEVIGKTTDLHSVENPECTLRIFYKNFLGELFIEQ